MKAEPQDTIAGMSLEQLRGPQQESRRPEPPVLTPAVVRRVVEDLHHVEDGRGYLGIAMAHGLTTGQVRSIDAARQRRIAELMAAEELEPGPGELKPKG